MSCSLCEALGWHLWWGVCAQARVIRRLCDLVRVYFTEVVSY